MVLLSVLGGIYNVVSRDVLCEVQVIVVIMMVRGTLSSSVTMHHYVMGICVSSLFASVQNTLV